VLGSNILPGTLLGWDRNASIATNSTRTSPRLRSGHADLSQMTGSVPVSADYVYIKLNETDRLETGQSGPNPAPFDMGEAVYYLSDNGEVTGGTDAAAVADAEDTMKGSAVSPVEGSNVYGELAYQWGNGSPIWKVSSPPAAAPAGRPTSAPSSWWPIRR
jgi:hypothetical protein